MRAASSCLHTCLPSQSRSPEHKSLLDRITVEPGKCGGRPCIRGMRIRVKDVLEMLAARVPEKEIITVCRTAEDTRK